MDSPDLVFYLEAYLVEYGKNNYPVFMITDIQQWKHFTLFTERAHKDISLKEASPIATHSVQTKILTQYISRFPDDDTV